MSYDAAHQTRIVIPNGVGGVKATLQAMRQLAEAGKSSPVIRQLALSLVQWIPEKDERAEVAALHRYVRDNIRYTRDIYGLETLHTPERLLELKQGDCDDKSILLASLLMSIGYPAEFYVLSYSGEIFDHVIVRTELPAAGDVIYLETTEYVDPGVVIEPFAFGAAESEL